MSGLGGFSNRRRKKMRACSVKATAAFFGTNLLRWRFLGFKLLILFSGSKGDEAKDLEVAKQTCLHGRTSRALNPSECEPSSLESLPKAVGRAPTL